MAYPSAFVDIQNAVIKKVRLEPTDDLAAVKDWINQVYAQVCVETEANQALATMPLTAGQWSYDLDATVLRIKEMYVTPVDGTPSGPLVQTNLDDILRKRQAGGTTPVTGSITHYALLGIDKLEVYPTPANADTITLFYVLLPAPLVGDTDVPILQEPFASKLLEYGACAEAADFKRDPSEGEYRALYQDWIGRFRAHLARKQGNQTQQFAVVGSGSYPPHDRSADVR